MIEKVPQTWRITNLGKIANEFISGGTPSTKEGKFWDGDIPWTTSAPISDTDIFIDCGQRFITLEGLENSASHLVPKGNLLVGTRVGVGKAVVNLIDIAISQDLTGIVLNSSATPAFIAYQFKTQRVTSFFFGRKRGTTIKGIARLDLHALPLSIPILTEQQAIVQALQAVQEAREARRREAALERERKTALMDYLFIHGTHGEPRKKTESGEIPQSWKMVRLNEVAKIERGKFAHRPRNDPAFYGGEIPFIQTGDVALCDGHIRNYSQTLNERGLSVSKIFPKGIIVITIAANIGYTGILDFDSAFPDSLIGITPKKHVNSEYLRFYLSTQQPEMDRRAPRGTQKNINIEFLAPWPVILPPTTEQCEIADALRACEAKIAALEQEATGLEELFRAMLEELMTGRLSALPLVEAGGGA